MSAKKPRFDPLEPGQRKTDLEDENVGEQLTDFSDAESQRVLGAVARAAARECGRQYFRALRDGMVRP